ncbi:Talin-1, partial [Kappamyces sp. JEL0680]
VLILTDRLDVSELNQSELVGAAVEVSNAVASLVAANKKATLKNTSSQNKLGNSIQLTVEASSALAAITSIMASVITNPLARDQLVDAALLVKTHIGEVEGFCADCPDASLADALQNAVIGAEEALAYLVEKAKNVDTPLNYEIQYYQEQIEHLSNVISDNIASPQDLFAAAKEMAINGTRLAEVLKLKASQTDDAVEAQNLEADARKLADLMASMVAATRAVITDPNNIGNQNDLLDTVESITVETRAACSPYVKVNMIANLIKAYKATISCCNHVVATGRQNAVATRDRTKHAKLNKAGKVVVEKIPSAIKAINEFNDNPADFVHRFKLIENAKEFIDPVDNLLGGAADASSALREGPGKQGLDDASSLLLREFHNFKELLHYVGETFDQVDYETVLHTMNLTKAIEPGPAQDPMDISQAEIEITNQSKSLGESLRGLAESLRADNASDTRKALATTVETFQSIQTIVSSIQTNRDSDGFRQELLGASATLGDCLTRLIDKAGRVSNNLAQPNELDEPSLAASRALSDLLNHLPRQKAMQEAMGSIRVLTDKLAEETSPQSASPKVPKMQ